MLIKLSTLTPVSRQGEGDPEWDSNHEESNHSNGNDCILHPRRRVTLGPNIRDLQRTQLDGRTSLIPEYLVPLVGNITTLTHAIKRSLTAVAKFGPTHIEHFEDSQGNSRVNQENTNLTSEATCFIQEAVAHTKRLVTRPYLTSLSLSSDFS